MHTVSALCFSNRWLPALQSRKKKVKNSVKRITLFIQRYRLRGSG